MVLSMRVLWVGLGLLMVGSAGAETGAEETGPAPVEAVTPAETAPAAAIEPAPVIPPETTAVMRAPPDCLQRDEQGRFAGWLDAQHCVLSDRATVTARWFDGLFGEWYGPDDARVRVKAVTTLHLVEGEGLQSGFSLRASAVLPNARRRMRLIITDEEDELRKEPSGSVVDGALNATSAAIRWLPEHTSRVRYTFDIGLRSTPDIYARLRARREWRISDESLFRTTQTLRYGAREEGRVLSQFEAERALDDKTVLLLSNTLQYWQNEPDPVGLRWAQDLVMLHRLGDQSSISYGWRHQGVQQPQWSLETRDLFVRYRKNVWRPWFYYEVEPHLTRVREHGWDTESSIIFRLEAQFGR